MSAHFKVGILAIVICLLVSPAMAAEISKSSLVFSGGRSIAQNSCESPWVALGADPGFACGEDDTIYRIAYIYKFTPVWGVEISGGDAGYAHGSGTQSGDPYTWQMKADGWTVAGIGNLSIGQSFSLFGKLGFMRTQLKEDIRRNFAGVWMEGVSLNGVPTTNVEINTLTYGAGFQYNFTENYALRLQYENFGQYDVYSAYGLSTPKRISLAAVSAGLVLSF